MSFLKNRKIQIYTGITILIVLLYFLVLKYSLSITFEIKKEETEENIRSEILQAASILTEFHKVDEKNITSAERSAVVLLGREYFLNESKKDTFHVQAKIENTGNIIPVIISKYSYKGISIYKNKQLLNQIMFSTGAYLSVFQKTEQGYVQVATNEPDAVNLDEISLIIPLDKPSVQKPEKGLKHFERKVNNKGFQNSVYSPIYINGKVKLIIKVTIFSNLSPTINKIFNENPYFKKGKMFILNSEGIPVNNTDLKNVLAEKIIYNRMLLNKNQLKKLNFKRKVGYKMRDEYLWYKYIKKSGFIVGIFYSDDDIMNSYKKEKDNTIYFVLFVFVVLSTALFVILELFFRSMKKIKHKLTEITEGKYKKQEDRFDLFKKEFTQLKLFLSEIEKNTNRVSENYETDQIKEINKNDVITRNLLDVNNKIQRIVEKQKENEADAKLRQKLTEGTAEINNLLQRFGDIYKLSNELIIHLTNFLEIEQGGFFVLNNDNPEDIYLEMTAYHAFDKERLKDKKIPINSGLLGRSVLEKESIFMTEIPENYTKISSGFGEIEPKSIVIVPLIFNNEVNCVIEMASIKIIEDYKIKFLENIGENIASTILNIKNSVKTNLLLEQTQIQSQQIETQRMELQEKIDTHRRQNRKMDKKMIELTEIIVSIRQTLNVIEYDLSGEIIDVSDRISKTIEVDKNEIIGKNYKDYLIDFESKKLNISLFREVKTGNAVDKKETLKINDKEYDIYAAYIPLKNSRGRVDRTLGFYYFI